MNTTSAAHAVSRWVILMLALGAGFSGHPSIMLSLCCR